MAIDWKSLNHLRAHRRSHCQNIDRGQIVSSNLSSLLHTPTALDKDYDDHVLRQSHAPPDPRYNLHMYVTAMIP
ncbi:UNVERIFIED_CONTAM: hypothetical protein Sangu_2455400 [Sesamum angustifolium]|uniref:Uncharacterized protein n=1 Tax=Sesamum angustifolium TaxID=2727405 RepID=A0AAW2KYH3_9LAMI